MKVWDYLIVGAGSSGCALADRLSASRRHSVLLLEAGSKDGALAIRVPGTMTPGQFAQYDWGYHAAPDPTRNNKSEFWPTGLVVGGSSSINGMNYVRGSASDYDRWARLGNHTWSASHVMPLFEEMERCDPKSIDLASARRGRRGPVHVRMVKHCHPATRAFIDAACAAGYPFTADYNGAMQEGVGYAQLTQRGGRRWSSADAFLAPALRRDNLELITNAHVNKLLIRDRRVFGVQYNRNGELSDAHARRVILCGGAINTPKLLMLSGIGDARVLAERQIGIVLDRKEVGRNLIEHPLIRVVCRVDAPTFNLSGGLIQKIRFLTKYLLRGEGPLASCNESIAFLRTRPEEPEPDVQLHFLPLGYTNNGTSIFPQLFPFPSITIVLNKNCPLSRGRMTITAPDPYRPPLIEPRMLEHHEDVLTLMRGLRLIRRITSTQPLAGWIQSEVLPGVEFDSDDAMETYIRRYTEPTYHPAGTCRMGVDEEAVVTPDLRVRGVDNLWIADASILPDLISGNTNAVCMMIGQKLGRALISQSGVAAESIGGAVPVAGR